MKTFIVVALLAGFLSILFVGIFVINNISNNKDVDYIEQTPIIYNNSIEIPIEENPTNINVNITQITTTSHHHSAGSIRQESILDIDCVEQIGSVTIILTGCVYTN